MKHVPTLRRELISAFALVFASALGMALVGLIFLLPRFQTPQHALLFIIILLAADLVIFTLFGRWVLHRAVFGPIETVIDDVEAIAGGDHARRLPRGRTQELARLSSAVNRMTERLVADQNELAANIRSLDETNRMLTEARLAYQLHRRPSRAAANPTPRNMMHAMTAGAAAIRARIETRQAVVRIGRSPCFGVMTD